MTTSAQQKYTVPVTIFGILTTLLSWSILIKILYNYYDTQWYRRKQQRAHVSPVVYWIISFTIFCFTCSTTVMAIMCIVYVFDKARYTYAFWRISAGIFVIFFGGGKMVLYISLWMRLYYIVQHNVLFNADYFLSKSTMMILFSLFLLCLFGYLYMISDPLYGVIVGFVFDLLFCLSVVIVFCKVLLQLVYEHRTVTTYTDSTFSTHSRQRFLLVFSRSTTNNEQAPKQEASEVMRTSAETKPNDTTDEHSEHRHSSLLNDLPLQRLSTDSFAAFDDQHINV
ncbi:hypothetical protein RFI_08026 [Reticulomyxa filosa]|uniref:Uncharacterized protein n=1 Tax=Reticulomyxa filosa TaxID=46433 RepID=X6NS41_RETFI|nr:hypothetical protein RFI_08026 [Reticulomyxa filosa]|eukprot:ETO29100.1 hypothetical protein RFI_08026 [Reticulomyxa filosa]